MRTRALFGLTAAALLAGSSAAATPPDPAAAPISSAGQSGGVTANYVGAVTQYILPPVVRGPQLRHFQETFTDGARTLRALKKNVSDDQIDQLCAMTNQWAVSTYNWIQKDIGDYPAERFWFRNGPSYSWDLPGTHKAGYAERRGNCIDALSDMLANIDNLMRDPTIYLDH